MPMNPIQIIPNYTQDFLARSILKPECDCDFFKLNFEELKYILTKIYGECTDDISLCILNNKISSLIDSIESNSINLSTVIDKIQLLNNDCETVNLCTINTKLDNLNIDVNLTPIDTKLNSIQTSINNIDLVVDLTPINSKLITIENKIIDLNRSCTAVNLCTINTKLDTINNNFTNLNVDVDLTPIDTKLNSIQTSINNIDLVVDSTPINSKLITIENKIIDLNRLCTDVNLCTINTKLDNLNVDVDLTPIDTKLNSIQTSINDINLVVDLTPIDTKLNLIQTSINNIDLVVDLTPIDTKLDSIQTSINNIDLVVDLTPINFKLITIENKIIDLNRSCTDVNLCTINTKLNNLNVDLTLIDTKLDSIQTSINNIDLVVDLTPVNSKLVTIESNIDSLDLTVDLSTVITEIQDLNAQIDTLNTRIIDLTDDVSNVGTTVTDTINNGKPRLASPIIIGEEIVAPDLTYEYRIDEIPNAGAYEWRGSLLIDTNDPLKKQFTSSLSGTYTISAKALSSSIDYNDSIWVNKRINVSGAVSNIFKLPPPSYTITTGGAIVNKSFSLFLKSVNALSYSLTTIEPGVTIQLQDNNAGIYSLTSTTTGNKEITVQAIGNGDNILDSDSVNYNITVNEITKLPTPILEYLDTPNTITPFRVRIKSHPNAVGYYWDTLLDPRFFELIDGNNNSQTLTFRPKTLDINHIRDSPLRLNSLRNIGLTVRAQYIGDGVVYQSSDISSLTMTIYAGIIPPPALLESNSGIDTSGDTINILKNENHNFFCRPNYDIWLVDICDSIYVEYQFSADDGVTWTSCRLDDTENSPNPSSGPLSGGEYSYIGNNDDVDLRTRKYLNNGFKTLRHSGYLFTTSGNYKLRYRFMNNIGMSSGITTFKATSYDTYGVFTYGGINTYSTNPGAGRYDFEYNMSAAGAWAYKDLVVT